MKEEIEIWMDIADYEGIYQVSDLGRIKSLSRVMKNARGFFISKDKILKPALNSKGYLSFNLYKEGCKKSMQVHIALACSFLNHKPNGHVLVVDHINGIKTDNRKSNLQIVTHSQNMQTCFQKEKVGFLSKYTGVTIDKRSNKWTSCIRYNNKLNHLGIFLKEEDASNEYKKALEHIKNGTFNTYFQSIKRKYSSEFKGVGWNKHAKKWRSTIRINGKQKCIGYFSSEQDALDAYIIANKKLA